MRNCATAADQLPSAAKTSPSARCTLDVYGCIVWLLCERLLQVNNVLRRPALVIRGGADLARPVGVDFRKLIESPFRSESRRTAEIVEQVGIIGLPVQSSLQRRDRAAESSCLQIGEPQQLRGAHFLKVRQRLLRVSLN